jgi:hypothetical protein
MDNSQKLDLIKHEYFKLQDFYEDFDKRIQTIKGWSITIALAAIAAGLNYKNEYLGLFASLSAVVFWIIETIWKIFQYHYRPRIVEIENTMKTNDLEAIIPLQIYSSWFDSFKNSKINFTDIAFLTIVFIPHLPIIILGLLFFIIQHYNIICFWN